MNKNILLFPGGFKPFHDGHLSILESYISNIDKIHIDEVRIYISYKDRDNITADTSLWFLNEIKEKLSNLYKVNIIPSISDIPSPIGKCYNDVSTNITHDKFCMVTSSKGNDIERKTSFINAYLLDGKKYDKSKGEQTIDVKAYTEPIRYNSRNDELNGLYVSSTIVRNDIKNKNFEQFKSAYRYMLDNNIVTYSLLYEYYTKLTELELLIQIYNMLLFLNR